MKVTHRRFGAFALVFLVYFMFSALPTGMLTPLLTSLGYSNQSIGLIFSCGALLGIGVSTLIGKFADWTRKIKPFVIIAQFLMMGVVSFLYASLSASLLCFIAGIAASALARLLSSLLDSWALEADVTIRSNYGAIRAFGSIGWALGLGLLVRYVDLYGFGVIVPVSLILGSLLLIQLFTLKDITYVQPTHEKPQLKQLFTPLYTLWIVVFFFVFFVIGVEDMTITMKFLELGASPSQIAWFFSAQALFELPLFFAGARLMHRYGAYRLLIIALFAMGCKMFLFAGSSSIMVMLSLSVIQILTFPLLMICSKNILYEASDPKLKISGQMVGGAITTNLSGIIAPLLIGTLAKISSVSLSLSTLGALLVIPFIITVIFTFRQSKV